MESPGGKGKEEEDRRVSPRPSKKIRLGKVAEMILVLSAMGKMRSGGVGPTDVEVGLMNDASEALAGVCEGFAPSEVFPKDAVSSVIEDLGLNWEKEQKPGFTPPKLSIAERMLVSKRKMEKADQFSLQSQSSQHWQGNSAASVEGRNPSRTFHTSNSNQVLRPTGIFPSVAPLTHGVTGSSISSPYQLPSSEVRPVVSGALPSSHLMSSGLPPRAERPQLSSDARLQGPSHAFRPQANYSSNSSVRAPPWSTQAQSVQSAKIGSENKVPVTMTPMADQGVNVRTHVASRTANTQTNTVPPSQSTKQVHASLSSTHSEIGKIIQKLLQPQVSENRKWVPPSREYMSRPVTCQLCRSTVTEVDSILICDACEKGYHLKCLQITNQKLPAGEWHCKKCLALSNGKPIPPKYGRVMRNMSTSKMSSLNSGAVPTSKNAHAPTEAGQQMAAANNSSMQNIPTGDAASGHPIPTAKVDDAKRVQEINNVLSRVEADNKLVEDAKEVQENNIVPSKVDTDVKVSSGTSPNIDIVCDEKNVLNPNTPAKPDIESNSSNRSNNQDGENVHLKSSTTADLEIISDLSHKSLTVPQGQDGSLSPPQDEKLTSKQSLEDHTMPGDSKYPDSGKNFKSNLSLPEKENVVHDNASEIASDSGSMIHTESSSDGLWDVDWVGEPIQDSEDKMQYASCKINGHEYRVADHVLIRFQSDKLVPSKIQAMWEDKDTKSKWVRVARCYFPGDLPETVGRPCGLESNEVCESSRGSIIAAGLTEGPCQVLPARNYAEEVERRRNQGTQRSELLPPLYLCRWIYDEDNGLFRDISC